MYQWPYRTLIESSSASSSSKASTQASAAGSRLDGLPRSQPHRDRTRGPGSRRSRRCDRRSPREIRAGSLPASAQPSSGSGSHQSRRARRSRRSGNRRCSGGRCHSRRRPAALPARTLRWRRCSRARTNCRPPAAAGWRSCRTTRARRGGRPPGRRSSCRRRTPPRGVAGTADLSTDIAQRLPQGCVVVDPRVAANSGVRTGLGSRGFGIGDGEIGPGRHDDRLCSLNYASFVASRLDNCQLVPITDLMPYVEDPEEFERELRALDVPAGKVRHPAVLGPLSRGAPHRGPRARIREAAHVAAREGGAPGPVPAHPDHVDGVRLGHGLRRPGGPGRGRRARPARGDPLPARRRCRTRPARRARALGGGVRRQPWPGTAPSCAARSGRGGTRPRSWPSPRTCSRG